MKILKFEECMFSKEVLRTLDKWVKYDEKEGDHTISDVAILTVKEYKELTQVGWDDFISFDVQKCVRNNTMENTMKESKIRELIKRLEDVEVPRSYEMNMIIHDLKAELPNKVWKPSEGDCGVTLLTDGGVYHLDSPTQHAGSYLQGNKFETGELASQERDLRAATKRVLDRVRELEQGEAVDWSDEDQEKYCLRIEHGRNLISITDYWQDQDKPTKYYSTDSEALEQVAKEMPDDVKLMLGVAL